MKKKAFRTIKETYREVCERSGGTWLSGRCFGGTCEEIGCKAPRGDFRGLMFHHKKHKGMGGSSNPEVHSSSNVVRICAACHSKAHGIREVR